MEFETFKDMKKQHSEAIHQLAEHSGADQAVVETIYNAVLENLSHEARITDYLPIIVSRQVRVTLIGRKRS